MNLPHAHSHYPPSTYALITKNHLVDSELTYHPTHSAMKIICTRFTSSSYRVHSLYDNVSPSSSLSPSEILAAQEALSLLRHYELIIENITRPPSAIDTAEVLEPNVREAEAWVRWQRREAMVLGGEDGSVQVLRPSTLQDGSLGRMAEAGMVREDPAEMEEFLSQLNGE